MIQGKRVNGILVVAMIFSLTIAVLMIRMGQRQSVSGVKISEPEYATEVFSEEIISIDILVEEKQWNTMIENALNEEFIMVDVVVNGTTFQNIGIRPKGNSSLSQVAQSESDRYSFRFQFDEYIKGQNCFGLSSFVVNNMIGDHTYMKEYLSYELMNQLGVDAPYYGFADIKVNGEDWGLYLAVELYNDSYENRVHGDTRGMLYNVKSMEVGAGMGEQMPGEMAMKPPKEEGGNQDRLPSQQREERMGGRQTDTGGSLEYQGDDSSSYSAIFDNVVGKATQQDYQRVIRALKALREGENLEEYFDIDQILRYLAAHTFVVNLDSYSSSMAQNYYIYEREGKLTILPWDYNLAWGGFQSNDATLVVNFPIHTPVSGVEMSTRPLISQLLEHTEYKAQYDTYLQQLIDGYFLDGTFEQKIQQLDELIGDYVKKDQTAFVTYEEYQQAVQTLITLGERRMESVQKQLDGILPSTTAGQELAQEEWVSADGIDLSDLGTMNGGGEKKHPVDLPVANIGQHTTVEKKSSLTIYLIVLLCGVLGATMLLVHKKKQNY